MSISCAPIADRIADFGKPLRQRREARGKARGDGGHGNARSFERLHGMGHHGGIDADGADGGHGGKAQRLHDVIPQRAPRLGAEAVDTARRVVSGQAS
jgi:hypothetical protein